MTKTLKRYSFRMLFRSCSMDSQNTAWNGVWRQLSLPARIPLNHFSSRRRSHRLSDTSTPWRPEKAPPVPHNSVESWPHRPKPYLAEPHPTTPAT